LFGGELFDVEGTEDEEDGFLLVERIGG